MDSVELRGIITRVYGRDVFTYSINDSERAMEFTSSDFIQPGESVNVLCIKEEQLGKTTLVARKIEKIKDIYSEIEQRIMERVVLRKPEFPEKEMEKMLPDMEIVARKIFAAQALGRFVTVKFHADADGISSALMLKRILKANYLQQNSAIYSVGDALRDLDKKGQHFKPLLIIVDFGSGQDSSEGISLAGAGMLEIMSIDHHPPSGTRFSFMVNPWSSGCEDGSKYPAGLLCAGIVHMLGAETDDLERIACAGDKSAVLDVSKKDRENALVLDFVATYSGFGNNIDFYSEVLSNKELFGSILFQANSKLEEADRAIKSSLKSKSFPEIDVFWFSLDGVSERREFPNRGKITSRAFELAESARAKIVIGIGKKTMIFRANDEAVAKGIRANEIINILKSNFSDFVENGGGHARAAALRIREGFESAALEEILKTIAQY